MKESTQWFTWSVEVITVVMLIVFTYVLIQSPLLHERMLGGVAAILVFLNIRRYKHIEDVYYD